MELEYPVKEAVKYFLSKGEETISSGFHHHFKPPSWAIVFMNPSDKLLAAAREAGCEIRLRPVKPQFQEHLGTELTDIYLPKVREDEPDKAKGMFTRLIQAYEEV
jgi:hypothetical protein